MGRWSTGSVIWLALAIAFGLGGATCSAAPGAWGGFVWIDATLCAFCLSAVAYCRVAARRGLWAGVAVLAACQVLLAVWVWVRPFQWYFDTVGFGNRPFDSVVWKQTRSEHYSISPPNPRGTMLRSLLGSGRLKHATQEEVQALLGPPDQPGWYLTGVGEHWDYEIGWFTGFQMDPDFLVIEFDGQGRVSRWSIVQS